ncbi:unnamed protein product [Prorocentrum cordatum]|uniref:Uncharacterized protein n=1 Tax=Prorocentrum cordatum TaxID=2364126 RepID=A0ABN9VXN6_9DINO|nr:unnamed protein product [Polarella glacialis]
MVRYMGSPGYVYSLAILVLLAVRGYHGNLWAGSYIATKQNLLCNDFDAFIKGLLRNHGKESAGEHHTWAAHVEGRHTAHTGVKPVEALGDPNVQATFKEVAGTWAEYVGPLLPRAVQSIDEDVLTSMADAIGKKVPLCLRDSGVACAGDYTKQNMLKCLNSLLPIIFNIAPVPYSQKLHEWLGDKQAAGSLCDSLHSFGLSNARDVIRAVSQLRVPASATADFSMESIIDKASVQEVSWATLIVHQCEVRQVLEAFPMSVIDRILQSPASAYKAEVSAASRTLFADVKRTSCFAVTLVPAAAQALGLSYEKPQRVVGSAARLLKISLALAKKGFSPKASVFGIPEWITLVEMALHILSKTKGQKAMPKRRAKRCQKQCSIEELRKKAQKFHINPRGKSKAKLLRMISSASNAAAK